MSYNSIPPDVNAKRIDTLFMRFTAIYGLLWLNIYQNEQLLKMTKKEWADSLKEFDKEILSLALQKTKKTHPYPPTLPVFVECCTSIKKDIEARQQTLERKLEPHKRTDPKIVQFHINKMKSILKSSEEKASC